MHLILASLPQNSIYKGIELLALARHGNMSWPYAPTDLPEPRSLRRPSPANTHMTLSHTCRGPSTYSGLRIHLSAAQCPRDTFRSIWQVLWGQTAPSLSSCTRNAMFLFMHVITPMRSALPEAITTGYRTPLCPG